jgi:hypothetical protein
VLPFEFNEERPEKDPQKKQQSSSYGFRNRWSWIAGALFAGLAILLKLLLLPRFEPSALFAGLAAFVSAAALWKWLLPRRDAASAVRGALVGGATGLLAPPLMWVLYGIYLLFSAAESIEALGWTLAYAYWMVVQVSAFTLLLGALVGAVLGYIQQVNARLPVKRSSSR